MKVYTVNSKEDGRRVTLAIIKSAYGHYWITEDGRTKHEVGMFLSRKNAEKYILYFFNHPSWGLESAETDGLSLKVK